MENHEVPFFPEATFTVGDSPINVRSYPDLVGKWSVSISNIGRTITGLKELDLLRGDSGNRNYIFIGPVDEAGNKYADLWGMLGNSRNTIKPY